jgi:hypothetical protein
MAIDRKHKSFRLKKVMPIDANNLNFEQAIVRFLVLLHTKGKKIINTSRQGFLYPEDLVQVLKSDSQNFEGINEPIRERLIENWISSDFAVTIKETRQKKGPGRISNFKPLHMATIKLLDPRVRSQDRDASEFLYNVFKDSEIVSDDSFLISFLLQGTRKVGQYDLKLDNEFQTQLDIEALFLLKLLDHFRVDDPNTTKKGKVDDFEFLCGASRKLFLNDTLKLLVYKDTVPRRELFQYLRILFAFHTSLFILKTFELVNSIVDNKKIKCQVCKRLQSEKDLDELCKCDFQPRFFVDLTNGQDKTCDMLAKQSVNKHYATMFHYFKSHYKLKKLDEFARLQANNDLPLTDLVKFLDSPSLEGYFSYALSQIVNDEENQDDPELKTILALPISSFDKYIEILCQDKPNWKNLVRHHKSLTKDLFGMNREDGFMQGGRGKQRKYVLGNQLLEVLVQVAVVGADEQGFKTKSITVSHFTNWLKNRYGVFIDSSVETNESPEIARALEANYTALKERLRQLGFFVDLSDASNSQVIRPRFPVMNKG